MVFNTNLIAALAVLGSCEVTQCLHLLYENVTTTGAGQVHPWRRDISWFAYERPQKVVLESDLPISRMISDLEYISFCARLLTCARVWIVRHPTISFKIISCVASFERNKQATSSSNHTRAHGSNRGGSESLWNMNAYPYNSKIGKESSVCFALTC